MKRISKKTWVLVGSVAAAAVLAVGAYAYFSAAGSGTGTFDTGTIGAVNITSDHVGPLYPQTNPGNVTPTTVHVNNTGGGNQYVGQITGSVADFGTCSGSWFTVAPISAPGLLSPGNHDFNSSVILNDSGGNQNGCANATITINWVSAAG